MPRERAYNDPMKPTPAEQEILDLMCQGFSNEAIAARLNKNVVTIKKAALMVLSKLQMTRSELPVKCKEFQSETPS